MSVNVTIVEILSTYVLYYIEKEWFFIDQTLWNNVIYKVLFWSINL